MGMGAMQSEEILENGEILRDTSTRLRLAEARGLRPEVGVWSEPVVIHQIQVAIITPGFPTASTCLSKAI
jgi:hypothetical protein